MSQDDPDSIQAHVFHFHAMATEFSLLIADRDCEASYASQVGAAVQREVERLEADLSRFKPGSTVWRIGLLQPGQSMRLDSATWDCLSLAKAMHLETAGALDVTIGPLTRLWQMPDGSPRQANSSELEAARAITGSHLFDLDQDSLSILVHAGPLVIDLGAIGKGYALDQSVNVLQDWGVKHAFLNAGDSSLLATAPPPGEPGWLVNLDLHDQTNPVIQRYLRHRALSTSGLANQGRHIIDPRTLHPVPENRGRHYALAPTAALSDALSTAFMVMSAPEASALVSRYPEIEHVWDAADPVAKT